VPPRRRPSWHRPRAEREGEEAGRQGRSGRELETTKAAVDTALSVVNAMVLSVISADTTLRLIDVASDGTLVTAWVANPDDATTAVKGVPHEFYDAIAADAADPQASPWGEALAALTDALFVDVDRLMIAGTPLAA
jgi:hypothetical protein